MQLGRHIQLWPYKEPPPHSVLLPCRECIHQRVKMISTLNTAREWEEKNHASVQANILSDKGLC